MSDTTAIIRFEHVSFEYAGDAHAGVRDLDLRIEPGQTVLLCGDSGCGKTTVTRLINGLAPHYFDGTLTGRVTVAGLDTATAPGGLAAIAEHVGSVFQNPKSQFFTLDVTGELAFACENFRMPPDEIRERIGTVARDFHMEDLLGRPITALSGGQKQKVACASVSTAGPDVLVLDEPSSNLDARAIGDLRAIVALWKRQGKTVVIAEHRLYWLDGLVDRALYLRDGRLEREMTGDELRALGDDERADLGLRPVRAEQIARGAGAFATVGGDSAHDAGDAVDVGDAGGATASAADADGISVHDTIDADSAHSAHSAHSGTHMETPTRIGTRNVGSRTPDTNSGADGTTVDVDATGDADACASATSTKGASYDIDHFAYTYRRASSPTLSIDHATLPARRITAVTGFNGAGKSTFVRCLQGLDRRCKGYLLAPAADAADAAGAAKAAKPAGNDAHGARAGARTCLDRKARLRTCFTVLQDVNCELFTESVLDEVLLAMPEGHEPVTRHPESSSSTPEAASPTPEAEREQAARAILARLDLADVADRHPLSLSGGQKQRVAIAAALASGREIIIFDEPTSGLDMRHMRQVAGLLRTLADQGHTVVVVTHDPEFALCVADDVITIDHGRVTDAYPLRAVSTGTDVAPLIGQNAQRLVRALIARTDA